MKRAINLKAKVAPMLSILVALALLFSPTMAGAIDWSEYEYEPGEGLHQEEWYDPGDWFDTGPGVDYERDWYDYTYNYPYDYDHDVFGYYGDDLYGYEYDYYSDDWYDGEGAFEE